MVHYGQYPLCLILLCLNDPAASVRIRVRLVLSPNIIPSVYTQSSSWVELIITRLYTLWRPAFSDHPRSMHPLLVASERGAPDSNRVPPILRIFGVLAADYLNMGLRGESSEYW